MMEIYILFLFHCMGVLVVLYIVRAAEYTRVELDTFSLFGRYFRVPATCQWHGECIYLQPSSTRVYLY